MSFPAGILKACIIPYNNTDSEYYGSAQALAIPAEIAAVGFNMGIVGTYLSMASNAATTITAPGPGPNGSVPFDQIQAMAQACEAAGIAVGVKVQVVPTGGSQTTVAPGMISITDGTYALGGSTISSPSAGFTSGIDTWGPAGGPARIASISQTGSGVITGQSFGDVPNSVAANPYGTGGDLTNTTCTYVSSTEISLNGGATLGQNRSGSNPQIVVINEAALATWFANYQTFLDEILALHPFDFLEVGTELSILEQVGASYWRSLVAHIRSEYPTIKITYGQTFYHYAFNRITWWDVCDFLGCDAYGIFGSTSGGETLATLIGYWSNLPTSISTPQRTYLGPPISSSFTLPAWAAAWDLPYIFTETGFKSQVGCASGTDSGTYSASDQANAIEAMLGANIAQPDFGGLVYWKWTDPSNAAYDPTTDQTYSPQGKTAASILADYLLPRGRFLADGTTRYRPPPP